MKTITFNDTRDFAAVRAAEAFCASVGLSVGRMERDQPRGLLFGDYDIQKWHNLRACDRRALHGQMTGDMRAGPVHVHLFDAAPAKAMAAFNQAEAA